MLLVCDDVNGYLNPINALYGVAILKLFWSGVYALPLLVIVEWVRSSHEQNLGWNIVVVLNERCLILAQAAGLMAVVLFS